MEARGCASQGDARDPVLLAPPVSLTLNQVVALAEGLAALTTKEMPGSLAERVVRLTRWAAPHNERFVKRRHELFIELGAQKDETGTKLTLSPEKLPQIESALQLFCRETVVCGADLLLDVKQLAAISISPADLARLEPALLRKL